MKIKVVLGFNFIIATWKIPLHYSIVDLVLLQFQLAASLEPLTNTGLLGC